MAEKTKILTKKELWKLIEKAEWTKDHDFKRIGKKYAKLPKREFHQLDKFHKKKHSNLYNLYYDAWLGNDGGAGIECSDDSWGDLINECVGRGKKFYNKIYRNYDKGLKKLQKMAISYDYNESFSYCFHKGQGY